MEINAIEVSHLNGKKRATYKLIIHQITHEPLTQVTLTFEYPCISTLTKDMLVQFSEFEVPPRRFYAGY